MVSRGRQSPQSPQLNEIEIFGERKVRFRFALHHHVFHPLQNDAKLGRTQTTTTSSFSKNRTTRLRLWLRFADMSGIALGDQPKFGAQGAVARFDSGCRTGLERTNQFGVHGHGSAVPNGGRMYRNPHSGRSGGITRPRSTRSQLQSTSHVSDWIFYCVEIQVFDFPSLHFFSRLPSQYFATSKTTIHSHLDNIDHVPFLDEEDFYDADHPVFDAKESKNPSDPDVNVWIYIQKDPIPADPSHPIPQSYVDIIMRGCLTISEDFARSFIETTAGWNDEHEDHWVDDRDVPIYKRADSDYSSANADMIDQLLDENTQLDVRVDYDPVVHLEALADALVDDMAHPLAIQHVVRRVKEAAQCARKKQRLDYDAET